MNASKIDFMYQNFIDIYFDIYANVNILLNLFFNSVNWQFVVGSDEKARSNKLNIPGLDIMEI